MSSPEAMDLGTSEMEGEQEDSPNEGSGGEEVVANVVPKIVPEMIEGIHSENPEVQLDCVKRFRKVISHCNPAIDEVIEAGVIPKFIEFLQQTENSSLQFEAAWVVTNIASGTSRQTAVIVQAGAVPNLIGLLRSPNEDVQEQAVWALGNIAGDNPKYRNSLVDQNIIVPLQDILERCTKDSIIKNTIWCLANLCRNSSPPPDFSKILPCLPTLVRFLCHNDPCVLGDACWAIAYLSDGPYSNIQAIVETGVCKRLVELLLHKVQHVAISALQAVGNIAAVDGETFKVILNCNALPSLLQLLGNVNDYKRMESCRTISKITAGSMHQIQAVIDANIIPALVDVLCNAEFKIRKEAALPIANAISGGTSEQIKFIASQGCINPLCSLLVSMDDVIKLSILNALEEILKVGEREAKYTGVMNKYMVEIDECYGLDKIKELAYYDNADISRKATDLMLQYFEVNSEEESEED